LLPGGTLFGAVLPNGHEKYGITNPMSRKLASMSCAPRVFAPKKTTLGRRVRCGAFLILVKVRPMVLSPELMKYRRRDCLCA